MMSSVLLFLYFSVSSSLTLQNANPRVTFGYQKNKQRTPNSQVVVKKKVLPANVQISEVTRVWPFTEDPAQKKEDDDLAQSITLMKGHIKATAFEGFPEDCPVVFDVGSNNGDDSKHYLQKGFCVVAVDANPEMIKVAKKKILGMKNAKLANKIHFVPMGMGDTTGNFTFYLSPDHTRSRFGESKAIEAEYHKKMEEITVPTVRCEALWELIPNRAPVFMKIDIEERHYTCVEALQRISHKQLPKYVSWEMHEYAKNTKFPELDTQLISQMKDMYPKMKIVSQRAVLHGGSFSGKEMPEDVIDITTHNKEWVDTQKKLWQGIPKARKGNTVTGHYDWWDYYMKLDEFRAQNLHDKKGLGTEQELDLSTSVEFIDSGADASVIPTSEAWEDIERKCDEAAVENFHPSQWLISEWTKTAKTPKLKIVEISIGLETETETETETDLANLPDQCRLEIMQRKTKTEACRDPWIKTKDCKHAYEVPSYRLGDLFFQYLCAPCNAQYTKHYFPGSIGDLYWREHKHLQDYPALERVVKSDAFKDYEKPDKDTLVLHVRGYDVMTVHSNEPQYRRSDPFYVKIAQKTASLGFKKAVIVTGDHWTTQVENLQNHGSKGMLDKTATATFLNALKATTWRVNQIAQIFNKTGMEVSKRMNWNSDCDFIFMSYAKAFVPSGGTFDSIVTHMVKHLNGTIYK